MTKKNKKKTDSKKPPGSNEPDINDNDSDSSTPVFHVGDRVELQGLKKMKRLNGRHGVVASELDESTGRFCIDLDLLDQLATVAAKPVNLKREAVPLPIDRAQVTGGMLVENQGRAFSLILDVLRYLVAFCLHQDPDIRHFPDIERVKDENLEKAQFLTASAWSYWDDPGANKGTGDRGIYQSAVEFIPEMFSVEDGNTNHLNHEEKRVLRAVTDKVAVAGWNHRIHGDFWIVAKDTNDGGTYAIPDDNKRAVYKVFGMTSCLYDLLQNALPGMPAKVKMTMVPWYGRLVYDGTVNVTNRYAPDTLAARLANSLQTAKAEGRVVERLIQLELPDEGLSGDDVINMDEPEKDATRNERLIISSFSPIPSYPAWDGTANDPGVWVFRRMGYTEEANPKHMGVILAAGGMIGRFECSALEPQPTDILKWLVQYSLTLGRRPSIINIDDKTCYKRVKHLLKDVEGTDVEYYPPPTEEELNAMNVLEMAGKDPFA